MPLKLANRIGFRRLTLREYGVALAQIVGSTPVLVYERSIGYDTIAAELH